MTVYVDDMRTLFRELEKSAAAQRTRTYKLEQHVEKLTCTLSDMQDRLGDVQHRVNDHESRIDDLRAHADAEGPAYAMGRAGEAKPTKRWAIVTSSGERIFTPWDGFKLRDACFPATFETMEFAALVRNSLFRPGSAVDLEEIEVVQREDGRLVEARYA